MKRNFSVALLLLSAFSSMAEAAVVKVTCEGRWVNDVRTSKTSVVVQDGCETAAMAKAEFACFSKLDKVNLAASEDREIIEIEVTGSFDKACCK